MLDRLLISLPANDTPAMYQSQHASLSRIGRPAYVIPEDQIRTLIENNFSVPKISKLLCVSISTVRRRMSSLNLSVLPDEELLEIVRNTQQQYLSWGNRQMYGYLISRVIGVPYYRVREAQRKVDPQGCMLRTMRNLRRRMYSVLGPQHLWHIDGHHKLIR